VMGNIDSVAMGNANSTHRWEIWNSRGLPVPAMWHQSRGSTRALSGSGKVWNQGSLLLRHHLEVSNVKKHLRPLDPWSKPGFWKACPPLHNEWIVPYYNWSSFPVKRDSSPHQRQFLTRVIDLHWLIFACERHRFKWARLKSVEVGAGFPRFQTKPFQTQFTFCQASKIASCHVPDVLTRPSISYDHTHIHAHILVYVCVGLCDIFGLRKYKRVSSAAIQSPPPPMGLSTPNIISFILSVKIID